MSAINLAPRYARPYLMAGLAAVSVLVLTSIHHAYGAVVYDTPWRMQMVTVGALGSLAIAACLFVAWNHEGRPLARAALWLGLAIIAVLPVVSIGVFEGAYNHVLKNLVYLAGNQSLYRQMFPAGTYEVPTDWFFEVTGIAQFPLAVWAALAALRLLRPARA